MVTSFQEKDKNKKFKMPLLKYLSSMLSVDPWILSVPQKEHGIIDTPTELI